MASENHTPMTTKAELVELHRALGDFQAMYSQGLVSEHYDKDEWEAMNLVQEMIERKVNKLPHDNR